MRRIPLRWLPLNPIPLEPGPCETGKGSVSVRQRDDRGGGGEGSDLFVLLFSYLVFFA